MKIAQGAQHSLIEIGVMLYRQRRIEFLQPLRPGVGPRAAYVRIRGSIPRLVDDRSLAEDVDRILGWMKDGALVAAAEAASGGLA